jgi:hypothetical protein
VTRCIRCKHPMKNATASGMGSVCERKSKVQPVPAHERDLFGYEVEKAVAAARYRLSVLIEGMAAEAQIAMTHAFRAARKRLGVWA